MLRSMFSAVAGLKAHQTKLDVTGNNIANVNTVGYKTQSVVFQDTLSQLVRAASAPTEDTGGTNPTQVGLGVKVAGVTTNFGQGSTQNTGRVEDFIINGDGFFVTAQGNNQLFTRAGSMTYDGTGHLVTPDGALLQGWTADANGKIDTSGPIDSLTMPFGQILPPVPTSTNAIKGNLNASAANPIVGPPAVPGAVVTSVVDMFDKQGNKLTFTYSFTKTGPNAWTMSMNDSTGTAVGGFTPVNLTFDATGKLTAPASGTTTFTATSAATPNPYANWGTPVVVDFSKMTQFSEKSGVDSTVQNGMTTGTLQSFGLTDDGVLQGTYSNGQTKALGQLAIASFNNPGGLVKSGASSFKSGDNSGQPLIGIGGSGSRGTLASGSLEMSNVDLAEEFTGLIIAQRGFQANSRVITTSDEILQELVQLKR
ncbi:flagellar hook-basal body complex protein [Modestobacter sp. I12A-02628]|uniref:Flagellar hook protein FlgE n=1 Tax=Goekera deserti TaxID=2497753 RepID=A0A7K3WGC9_9ACTN|nr:flagellar hook protein FlgE [Goekera deserti]MPQ99495.1 flagellar hook-basal body complex protein [Goekera deserti]NDI48982.1 flagellar hook-basal body complex protein [Goekera deserti]NEL55548.1 flagellar hook protein FlgE [Goekera deserti]